MQKHIDEYPERRENLNKNLEEIRKAIAASQTSLSKETERAIISHLHSFPERQELLNDLLIDIQRTNAELVAFMKRAEDMKLFENLEKLHPIIERFEQEHAMSQSIQHLGKRAIFWSKIIGAIGVIIIAIKYFIMNILSIR